MYQQQKYGSSRSPPPLHHPKPTHPPFQVPDPPMTPVGSEATTSDVHMTSARSRGGAGGAMAGGSSGPPSSVGSSAISGGGGGYVRYSSPPINQHQQQPFHGALGSGAQFQAFSSDPYAAPQGNMGAPMQSAQGQQGNNNMGGFGNFGGFVGGSSNGAGGSNPFPINDHTAQMGMHIGRQMAQASGEYVNKNFNRFLPIPLMKHYFNVSNSYVLHKLRLVLFPWRHKPWSRAHRHAGGARGVGGVTPGGGASMDSGGAYPGMVDAHGMNGGAKFTEGFAPPREDVNSPDLYIPAMAVVTYVLLVSVIRGLESRFHPEELGVSLSKALGIIFFEFVLVKLGCYLLNIQGEHTIIDLFAYSGYKFIGVIITLVVGLTHAGRLAYWSVWAYTTAANAFFLLRSLRYVVLPDPSSASSVTISQAQRSRRIQFLFSIAVAQSVFGWLLIIGIWH